MDDEKKIIEKRLSFRGWKERNKGKSHQKIYTIGIVTMIVILSLVTYPYWHKDRTVPIVPTNISVPIKKVNFSDNSSSNIVKITPKITPQMTVVPTITENKVITGKIGTPFIINGFEITIQNVVSSILYANVWVIVKNTDNKEKLFKIGTGTVLIDNIGEQYENINVKRSAEIAQTNLAAKAIKVGAIFFEALKEKRKAKKLILNINEQQAEILLEK